MWRLRSGRLPSQGFKFASINNKVNRREPRVGKWETWVWFSTFPGGRSGAVGMWGTRGVCELSKGRWKVRETCCWFSVLSMGPTFPQPIAGRSLTAVTQNRKPREILKIHLKEQRSRADIARWNSQATTHSEHWPACRFIPAVLKGDALYDAHLDRFLLDLPTNGLISRHSLRSYGYDIVVWVRFLEQARSKSVWEADGSDVTAFHRLRRNGEAATRISGISWNRSVAALEKLYLWGVEETLLTQSPFRHRQIWRRGYGGKRAAAIVTNASYERAVKPSDTCFLMLNDFHRFRDVGILGLDVDGRAHKDSRSRNGLRNALFVELLIATGLRLEEGCSLLACEVEEAIKACKPGQRQLPFRLPVGLTKGNKGRTIRMPVRLLARFQAYLKIERDAAVLKFRQRAIFQRMKDPILCRSAGPGRLLLQSSQGSWLNTPLDRLTPDDRRNLVFCDAEGLPQEPAALWLSEVGVPISPNCWEVVFDRANQRCAAAGITLNVSPHHLRHAFAVHMLALLIRECFGRGTGAQQDPDSISYRRLIGDPLQQVQRLLGHSCLRNHVYIPRSPGRLPECG